MRAALLPLLLAAGARGESCFQQNKRYVGDNVLGHPNIPIPLVVDAEDCQVRCELDSLCQVFTYYPNTRSCWVQAEGSKLEDYQGAIVGPSACTPAVSVPTPAPTTPVALVGSGALVGSANHESEKKAASSSSSGGSSISSLSSLGDGSIGSSSSADLPLWAWLLLALALLLCLGALAFVAMKGKGKKGKKKRARKAPLVEPEAPVVVAPPVVAAAPVVFAQPVPTQVVEVVQPQPMTSVVEVVQPVQSVVQPVTTVREVIQPSIVQQQVVQQQVVQPHMASVTITGPDLNNDGVPDFLEQTGVVQAPPQAFGSQAFGSQAIRR